MKKLYFILSIVLLAMAYPIQAATNWQKYRIMIDPGHGGSDPGALGYGGAPHEATLVLSCGLKIRDYIVNQYGGTVKMTRETDVFVDLSPRRELKGSYDPYIFCSIHLNAFNKSARGTGIYYTHTTGTTPTLAKLTQARLLEQFSTVSGFTPKDRGIEVKNLAVTRGYPNVPAILTEGLFVDSPIEWPIVNSTSKDGFKKWVYGHLLGFYDRLVLLQSDIIKPTFTSAPTDTTVPTIARCVAVSNNATSFYVYAQASDNIGVTSVKFPTWTEANGQDDIIWYEGVKGSYTANSQSYNYRYLVDISKHNNEKGKYHIHPYAYDAAGNYTNSATTYTFTATTPPTTETTKKITSDPTSVTLTGVYGATTKPYKDVKITATGLEADILFNSSTTGIVVTSQSDWNARTGGTLRFTLNTNFTSGAGEYLTGKFVAVESGSGTSKVRIEIPVAFTLTAAETNQPVKNPAITVSPSSLTFSGEEGATIASQKVTVTGTDLSAAPTVSGATDKFTITSSLTATGGTITIAPKTTLAVGTHTSTITVAADGVSKTISLTANIAAKTITPDPTSASIKSNPTSVSLTGVYGATTKPYKDVKITATGLEADMVFNSSTSGITVASQSGWDARTGGTLRFTLNTNFTSGAGEYLTGKFVAVESGSGTSKTRIEIPVAFTLTASGTDQPAKNPTITVTPASLSFSGEEGATITSQKVTVTGKDLSAAPTVSGATDKFTVTSSLTATGGTLTVAPKATLTVGTHTANITIAADGVSKTVNLTANITAKQTTNPTPETGTPDATYGNVKFFLQGGKLDVPADNEALWELFKPDYNTYYSLSRSDQPIANVATFATPNMKDFLTNSKSSWKWLGDYILSVAPDLATGEEVNWRFTVQGFFNCYQEYIYGETGRTQHYACIGDWTTAGKPEAWKAAYTFAHKPTKSGATFLGWFTNANATGSALTACPSSGNVYACWSVGTTALENITTEVHILPTESGVELLFQGTTMVTIYTINGTMVNSAMATDYYTCDLQPGMYIIRVGSDTYKFVK